MLLKFPLNICVLVFIISSCACASCSPVTYAWFWQQQQPARCSGREISAKSKVQALPNCSYVYFISLSAVQRSALTKTSQVITIIVCNSLIPAIMHFLFTKLYKEHKKEGQIWKYILWAGSFSCLDIRGSGSSAINPWPSYFLPLVHV